MPLLTPSLLSRILDGYALPRKGVHGIAHWARVLENGRRVAALTPSADADLIELFAVFHDARRVNEAWDRGHGDRGADLAAELRGQYFDIDDERFALLQYACQEHTSGRTRADPSVQVCWDADRLDLLRVGTKPRKEFLCTEAARTSEIMEWANRRAARWAVPELIAAEWGLADS
jgi:uncharacterized protein